MKFILLLTSVALNSFSVSAYKATTVADRNINLKLGAPNADIIASTKPTDAERLENPHKIWYFDKPELILDPTYLLTNDYGRSSPYLVEAANETHWAAQKTPTVAPDISKRSSLGYINSYSRSQCPSNTYQNQWTNPGNGACHGWWPASPSVFAVGSGDFQVNMYGNSGHNCDSGFLGGMRGWSGCYSAPWADDGQLIYASWVALY